MATEKLAEGIRGFIADIETLERELLAQYRPSAAAVKALEADMVTTLGIDLGTSAVKAVVLKARRLWQPQKHHWVSSIRVLGGYERAGQLGCCREDCAR